MRVVLHDPLLAAYAPCFAFIVFGGRFRVAFSFITLLCCMTLVYNMIKAPVVSLIWYLYSALYFGNYLLGAINNYTLYLSSSESQAVGKTREDTLPCSFTFPHFIILLSSRLVTIALSREFWMFQAAQCYCHVSWMQSWFCLKSNICKNTTRWSAG